MTGIREFFSTCRRMIADRVAPSTRLSELVLTQHFNTDDRATADPAAAGMPIASDGRVTAEGSEDR
jgi:hypothetical protein